MKEFAAFEDIATYFAMIDQLWIHIDSKMRGRFIDNFHFFF